MRLVVYCTTVDVRKARFQVKYIESLEERTLEPQHRDSFQPHTGKTFIVPDPIYLVRQGQDGN
jgi:hypothetical protein